VALWKVTSGTTGVPRAIAFSADQILADASQIISTMGITSDDRNFGLIPFSHSYGFSNLITPLLFFGTPVVVAGDALPRSLATALVQSEATIWPAVPAFFPGLVSLGFRPAAALRKVISAGAPLAARVAQGWLAQTGLRIHGFYGSSECGGICFDREGCTHEADAWVGTPMDGVSLEFFPLPESAADEGTLRVCSAANGIGIFPSAPDDPLRDGAFFPTDLVIHEKGGYRIAGRLSDTINIGAKKVHPYEIERALLNLPGVHEAVVFGIPAAGGRGESIAAAVCGNLAPDERSLREALAHSLPAWKIPRSFFFLDTIPFNSRGKLNRRELACALVGQQETTSRFS
jgi:long-chain acyl-CoA synthetase